jgi:MAF protein
MALGNWGFRSCVSQVDEDRQPGEAPADYVLRLAEAKARAAIAYAGSHQFIVAADTVVVDGQDILGKPAATAQATRMLVQLRGRRHQVYTGLAVLKLTGRQMRTDLCVTDVPMRGYSDAEIVDYVATGDPFDKAGGYAIQHPGFRPVDSLSGCFASVMGLPLCHLARVLARMDATPQDDLPMNCQAHLHYECPVSGAILRGEQVG